MMRKLISCSFILSYLVNWRVCDGVIVRKVLQGNGNYSDILVTKYNYNSYLTNIPNKLPHPLRNQSEWELVSMNATEGSTKFPTSDTPTDIYTFNCTLNAKATTKLIPLLNRNATFSTKFTQFTPIPIKSKPTRIPPARVPIKTPKKKVIYVNPPVISAVENVLNSAYDFVENSFVTKTKVRVTTSSPRVKRLTKTIPNENKLLTTQVHVTNAYEPAVTQMAILTSNRLKGASESGSSEEYSEEDLLYYDAEDDDEDFSDNEDSIESPPIRTKPVALKPSVDKNSQIKPWVSLVGQEQETYFTRPNVHGTKENNLKKKRRPVENLDDSYEYYDDQEDEDGLSLEDTFKYGSPEKQTVLDYFSNVMMRFGKFITTLMGMNGRSKRKQVNKGSHVLSTISKNRRPKRPAQNYYDFHSDYHGMSGNGLETKEATALNESEKGMWSGLSMWFMGDDTATTVPPEDITGITEDKSWFFNMFSTTSTTSTTEKPETTALNPLDPGNFIALLAQHLVTTEASVDHKPNESQQKKVDYADYQLWRLRPSNSWKVRFLTTLRSSDNCSKCQWWKGPSLRGPTDLVIPPESVTFIEETLQNQGIMYEVVISDLQKAITYSNPRMTRREQYEIELEQGHPVTFYRYHRFDEIVKFLEFLQRKYPENVELNHFGRSFEGLPLIMVKIFSESEVKREPRKRLTKNLKPVVMIEAGSHGREWIGPAVAMWILNTLAMGVGRNDSQSEIFRAVDWLIVPVLNPDGYEYTHTHDRLWRKTRSRARPKKSTFLNSLPFWTWFQGDLTEEERNCTGVDLNRNWSYEWTPKGITGKPCGDIYSGSRALSEPETTALYEFAMKNKKTITVFLSLHSYGQMISIPKEVHGRNDNLIDMAHVAAQALKGYSTLNRYLVDDTNEMLFPRPGAVDAFMLNTIGVPYSYTLELRDTGTHGFLLPPSYIEATARDAFDIIKAIVDNL